MSKHIEVKFLLLALCLISGCSSKPHVVENAKKNFVGGQNQVYVVSHGWHTGFVIPAPEIQGVIPELEQRFGDTPYIEFGWGDKGFYQAKETTLGLTLRAIFWPTESVVHSVAVPQKVEEYFLNSEGGCLLGNWALEVINDIPEFKEEIQSYFNSWENAIFEILLSQYSENEAKSLAKQSIANTQGALMMMRLYNDKEIFLKEIKNIKGLLQ